MEKIRIRPIEPRDADFYAAIQNDSDVRRHIGPTLNVSVEECRGKMESGAGALRGLYVIEDIEGGCSLGICGFTPNNYFDGTDVLVQLSSKYQKKGIGTEVLSNLIDLWFGEKANDALFASVSSGNKPAIALLEKFGFNFDAEYEDACGSIHHKYVLHRKQTTT